MPTFPTFLRLVHSFDTGLDVAVVGITLDSATSNRSGTRFGPRQIRTESSVIWPENTHTGSTIDYRQAALILMKD